MEPAKPSWNATRQGATAVLLMVAVFPWLWQSSHDYLDHAETASSSPIGDSAFAKCFDGTVPTNSAHCRFVAAECGSSIDVWVVDSQFVEQALVEAVRGAIAANKVIDVSPAFVSWLMQHGKRVPEADGDSSVLRAKIGPLHVAAKLYENSLTPGILSLAVATPFGERKVSIALATSLRSDNLSHHCLFERVPVSLRYQQWDTSGNLTGEIVDSENGGMGIIDRLRENGFLVNAYPSIPNWYSVHSYETERPLAILQSIDSSPDRASSFFVRYL